MTNNRHRGVLASAGALVTVAALALGGAAAAQAITEKMPSSSGLVITKLEQPDQTGSAATGLPQNTGLPALAGVAFEAYEVPLKIDPMTDEGRKVIANTTLADAQALVIGETAGRQGVTDAEGEIHWQTGAASEKKDGDDLAAGLWLVRETSTPAGVVPAGDFLVGVPLTNPSERGTWLNTIYVYPKNHMVEGSKTVDDTADFVVGNTVTWTIAIDNPSPRDTGTGEYGPADMLQVIDVLEDEYLTTPADGSGVLVTAPEGLVLDLDYTVSVVPSGGKTTVTIDFTSKGLEKVALVPTESVVLTLATVIEKAGVIENSARFFTSTTQTDPKEIPGTSMKYGSYALVKQSEGAPSTVTPTLSGAEFMVFTKEADALAAAAGETGASEAAVRPNIDVPGYDQAAGTWTTDAQGRVAISGLRYSGFAEGESFGDTDERFITYWLVETKSLDGHQLLAEPIAFVVDEDSATQVSQTIVNQYDRGGFLLPLTGGMGTILLTLAGIALLTTVLMIARRRRLVEAATA